MQTIVYECLMTYCASGLAGIPEDGRPGKDDTGWPREMQNLLSQQGKGKFSQEQHAQCQKLQAEKRQQEERRKKQKENEKRHLGEDKKRLEEEKRKQEEEKRRLKEEKRLDTLPPLTIHSTSS